MHEYLAPFVEQKPQPSLSQGREGRHISIRHVFPPLFFYARRIDCGSPCVGSVH